MVGHAKGLLHAVIVNCPSPRKRVRVCRSRAWGHLHRARGCRSSPDPSERRGCCSEDRPTLCRWRIFAADQPVH